MTYQHQIRFNKTVIHILIQYLTTVLVKRGIIIRRKCPSPLGLFFQQLVKDFRRNVGDVDVRRFGKSVFGSVVAGLINCVWAKVPDSVKIGDRGARYKQDEISRSVIQTIITLARRTFHFIITIFKLDVLNSTFCYRTNNAIGISYSNT